MNRFGRLTVIAAAAAAIAGASPGLAAASAAEPRVPSIPAITLVSPIASGYAAVPKPGGTDFIHVQASFTLPALSCTTTPNGIAQMRAGLDGVSDNTVERVGVSEACKNGAPAYAAWYQMFPAMSSPAVMFHPGPGDLLEASVTTDGGLYTLSIQDLTSGMSFTANKSCASCLNSSAEVTAGSPPGVAPADFTVVHFNKIVVTNGTGVTGGLANPAWLTDKLAQPGSPHTVADPLHTFSSPAHSALADTWAP
jgi:hypothetical protein